MVGGRLGSFLCALLPRLSLVGPQGTLEYYAASSLTLCSASFRPAPVDGCSWGGAVFPIREGVPERIQRRVCAPDPFQQIGLVPFVDTVHNRLTVEIRRGCTRGCRCARLASQPAGRAGGAWEGGAALRARLLPVANNRGQPPPSPAARLPPRRHTPACRFCQPGMLTRPARDVEPSRVVDAVEHGMRLTGYNEFSLLSLSCSDYLSLPSVGIQIKNRLKDENVALSLPSQVRGFAVATPPSTLLRPGPGSGGAAPRLPSCTSPTTTLIKHTQTPMPRSCPLPSLPPCLPAALRRSAWTASTTTSPTS